MSWETSYSRKIKSADEALRQVESGMRVYIQPGCAEPETLVEALMRRAPAVRDVEIVHAEQKRTELLWIARVGFASA
jgi:4-hydroxybutyrate CoA-transferase